MSDTEQLLSNLINEAAYRFDNSEIKQARKALIEHNSLRTELEAAKAETCKLCNHGERVSLDGESIGYCDCVKGDLLKSEHALNMSKAEIERLKADQVKPGDNIRVITQWENLKCVAVEDDLIVADDGNHYVPKWVVKS